MKARTLSIFLLGKVSGVKSRENAELEKQTNEALSKYGIKGSPKYLVRKDKDILKINIHETKGFIVFPYTTERFAPLVYLAETKKPILIVGEEETLLNALETYDYLSDHDNVRLVFNPEELKAGIKKIERTGPIFHTKVCVFDSGQWQLDGVAWQKNPLFQGRLNTQNVNVKEFLRNCECADKRKAERLAKKWIKESEVLEPSFQDVVKTARIYLAMKTAIEEMKADAAYVLWCGQFTEPLAAKMCFSLAKLADDGIPTGCWRGGNLLPLLILHAVSQKPVFTPEAVSYHEKTITLRHCFAPAKMAAGKYRLRRWRDKKGTVTGYVQMPEKQVTLANCAAGDKIVIARGKVIDCKDLGDRNCRMTIWVEIEKEETIHKLVGREFALVYGDYEAEAEKVARNLGMKTL